MKKSVFTLLSLAVLIFATSAGAAPICRQAHVAPMLTSEQIFPRIDQLATLQMRLQTRQFQNQSQIEQALAYFEHETKALALAVPDFKRLYQERYIALRDKVKHKQRMQQQKTDSEEQRRKEAIRQADNVLNPREIQRIEHNDIVWNADFSPDGKFVATASTDKTSKIVEISTGHVLRITTHEARVISARFSPDGTLVGTASQDGKIRIADVFTDHIVYEHTFDKPVVDIAFSSDGASLVATLLQGGVFFVNTKTWQIEKTLQFSNSISTEALSPDRKLAVVVVPTADSSAQVIEIDSGQVLQTIAHSEEIIDASFSPDGKLIATASRDGTAQIVDVASGQVLQTIHHNGWVYSATFSPNEKFLATASRDGTVQISDVTTGTVLYSVEHSRWVQSATFSRDSRMVITNSWDKSAIVTKLYSEIED